MAYVVTENCIHCKYMKCVAVCPTKCFHEGETMLVIDPDECINCDECRRVCPAKAIRTGVEPALEQWIELNARYAKLWPSIVEPKPAPADAREWDGRPGKFPDHFSPAPASE